MTLQDKIQQKANEYGNSHILGHGKVTPAFIEGAKFALENQWISVKDDLPCNYNELLKSQKDCRTKSVIACFDSGMRGFTYMVKTNGKWEWKFNGVTHWMIIPELPNNI